MLQLAKFKHFDDDIFKKYQKEANDYYKYRGQELNWCRHWEYPWVLKYGQFSKNDTVLDAGGGYNYFPCILSSRVKEVVVLDKNPISLNHCVSFTPRFICQNLEDLCLTEQFDKVISISVIEHIDKWEEAIKKLIKCVKVKGLLILTINVDLNNKRPIFYSQISKILSIFNKQSIKLIGHTDIDINDEFTKEKCIENNIILPDLDKVRIGEERYTIIGIIAQKEYE